MLVGRREGLPARADRGGKIGQRRSDSEPSERDD